MLKNVSMWSPKSGLSEDYALSEGHEYAVIPLLLPSS